MGANSHGPIIFAVAGAPGAGKSTFIQRKWQENFFPKGAFIHDPDAVMESLEGYQSDIKSLGSAKTFIKWELPAREKSELMLLEAVKAKKDIVYDRTCGLPNSYDSLKEIVEVHGYTLFMHVLYVTVEKALSRAEEREKRTGRHIPTQALLERMKVLSSSWPSYLKLAKFSYLYDSNDNLYHIIAQGNAEKLSVVDKEKYAAFLKLKE